MAFLHLLKLYMVFQNSPLTTFPFRNLGSFRVSVIFDFDLDLPVLIVYLSASWRRGIPLASRSKGPWFEPR